MSRFIMVLRLYVLCIITVLLFGLTGTVTAHIVATFVSDTDSLFIFVPFVFGIIVVGFLLIFHYALILTIIGDIAQLRLVDSLRQQDYKALPECEQQPAITDALHDGDTLLLQRTSTLSRSLRQLGTIVITCFILFALTEMCSILVSMPLSAWFGTRLGLSSTTVPTLAPLDWLVLLYPLIFFGAIFVIPTRNIIKESRWQLRADAAGITLQSGRKSRFIAWNMLQAIVQSKAKFTPDFTTATYHLVGKNGSLLSFTIDNSLIAAAATSRFTYVGGYEQYNADVVRLLATIRARSMLALRYNASAIRMKRRLQQRMPITAIDTDTILASTIAEASWQPVVISAPPTMAEIKVAPRLSRWTIFWQGVIWETILILSFGFVFYLTGSISLVWGVITQIRLQPIVISSYPRNELIFNVLLLIFLILLIIAVIGLCLSLGFVITYTTQRQRLPELRVTLDGIIDTTQQDSSQPNVITWKDIWAWLVMPATATRDFDTYVIVYGANKKMYWRVNRDMELAGRRVAGDRKIAFQEKLAEAHSIIAARTGLPLRLIESNDAPV